MIESSFSWYLFRLINVGVMVYVVVWLWRRYGKQALIEAHASRQREIELTERQISDARKQLSAQTLAYENFLTHKQELLSKVIGWKKNVEHKAHQEHIHKQTINDSIAQKEALARQNVYREKSLVCIMNEIMPELERDLGVRYSQETIIRSSILKSIERMKGSL